MYIKLDEITCKIKHSAAISNYNSSAACRIQNVAAKLIASKSQIAFDVNAK